MTTLYYDSSGDCYDAPSGGDYVETQSFEIGAADTVPLDLEPTSSGVPPLSQSITSETKVPSNHAGDAVWSTSEGSSVTITFDVPPNTNQEWGWDYDAATLPVPLKLKVRVKRV